MTMREKVQKELMSARLKLEELKQNIEREASDIKRLANDDAYGMTAGLATNHGALNLTIYGTRFRETQDRISMLEYILRDDAENG